MKRLLILIFSLVFVSSMYGQQGNESNSKMDKFTSRTGAIVKFEDYELSSVKITNGFLMAKIRKVSRNGESKAFYQMFTKDGKFGSHTASIAYEDLIEIQKAIITLKSQASKDSNSSADSIINKFVNEDGFRVGYLVDYDKKVNWYVELESNAKSIFINDVSTLEDAFNAAKTKMDTLK